MTDEELLIGLRSGRWDDTLRALGHIGSLKYEKLTPEVLSAALPYLESGDVDLQHEAIFALLLHWKERAAYETIVGLYCNDRLGREVVEIAISGLAAYATQYPEARTKVFSILRRAIMDDSLDKGTRGRAYRNARELAGLITPAERGVGEESLDDCHVDWEWVVQLGAQE